MFCTLKAGNVAGEPYAFEATPPPFSKKQERKTSKVACTNCRTSKLRCSGEPGRCRRCYNKKFECEYPSPPRSNSQSKAQSPQHSTLSKTPASESPVETESPCELSYDANLPDVNQEFSITDLPTPSATESLIDDDASKHISLEIEALWQKHQLPLLDNNSSFGASLADIDDIVFETPANLPAPTTAGVSGSSCSCSQQALSTSEAIEVTMWGQNELSSDIYDILQEQKAALTKCEELLDCRTCCLQASYVMLLLSMCRRLLATFDKICLGSADEENYGAAVSADSGAEQRKRKRTGLEGGGTDSWRGNGIIVREKRLDEDDESLVLQSLVAVRVKMLNRTLGRINEVVSQNNWPVHKGVCRELQTSLNTRSYTTR